MIYLKNIVKTYEGDIHALRGIDLSIERGSIYGIIGLSGAGKSTLIRCINLLERPTRGQVVVDGKDLTVMNAQELRAARQNIGMIFQQERISVLVDERCFYEHSRHRCQTQHDELGALLHTAISRAKSGDNLPLYRACQGIRLAAYMMNQCFRTSGNAIRCIAMYTDENICLGIFRRINHTRKIRRFPCKIVALQHFHEMSALFQIRLKLHPNLQGDVALPQSRMRIDSAAVEIYIMSGIQKNSHCMIFLSCSLPQAFMNRFCFSYSQAFQQTIHNAFLLFIQLIAQGHEELFFLRFQILAIRTKAVFYIYTTAPSA